MIIIEKHFSACSKILKGLVLTLKTKRKKQNKLQICEIWILHDFNDLRTHKKR